jgi:hypothetical protein
MIHFLLRNHEGKFYFRFKIFVYEIERNFNCYFKRLWPLNLTNFNSFTMLLVLGLPSRLKL